MKDYRVEVKVKNNNILALIESAGFKNVASFSEAIGLHQTVVGDYINLKISPIHKKTGAWRESAISLASALKVIPEILFSDEQITALDHNSGFVEVDFSEMQKFIGVDSVAKDPLELLIDEESESKSSIQQVLEIMPTRLAKVLRLRYGLNDQSEHTQKEVGEQFGVCNTRAAQMEKKAIRVMKQIADRNHIDLAA